MEKNQTRKLSGELVMQMRQMYGEGATQGHLARYFGVSIGHVGRIVRGEVRQEGTGARMPTQAEMDASLARLLKIQEDVQKYGPSPAPWERKRVPEYELPVSEEVEAKVRSILGKES